MKYNVTPQEPTHSGFGSHTTAREVLRGRDLSGAIAIVAGGYSGIGLETTRALAEAGATVIAPARTPEKARASIADIAAVVQPVALEGLRQTLTGVLPWAVDSELAERLWVLSEELTGVKVC
jgi:NAD(P)-dependent dehydrogenase (short-subunit alcohol dehydrogenase family)